MKEVTITISVTEDDLETLKGISISDDKSGIINHIYHLAVDKFGKGRGEVKLTPIQDIVVKGLIKGEFENINYPIPLNFFNVEYFGEISQLKEFDMIDIKDLNGVKMIYLNSDYTEKYETLDMCIEEYKKMFNVK